MRRGRGGSQRRALFMRKITGLLRPRSLPPLAGRSTGFLVDRRLLAPLLRRRCSHPTRRRSPLRLLARGRTGSSEQWRGVKSRHDPTRRSPPSRASQRHSVQCSSLRRADAGFALYLPNQDRPAQRLSSGPVPQRAYLVACSSSVLASGSSETSSVLSGLSAHSPASASSLP